MGLTGAVRRLARAADARVFCVAGSGARDQARLLRLREGIQLEPTPRAANIMLIVGDLDSGLVAPALVAHDALVPPRATVWWPLGVRGDLMRATFPDAVVLDDPVAGTRRVHEELVRGQRRGDPPLLPDVEPAPWRGVGPYGQGGKAMTGGVPFGRPMAERADDRDGLKLDYLPVRVGPLFAPFPTGLAFDLKLHGDVIQEAKLENFASAGRPDSIFLRALRRPVPIRDVELARARSHLYWLSDAVMVGGPPSLAVRILRLAQRLTPGDADSISRLERALRRRGFSSWATRGVGVLPREALGSVSGPVARAAGSAVDARTGDPAYRHLGFEPTTQQQGDAAARWVQRVREAGQALELAERAEDAVTDPSGVVESPRGTLTQDSAPSADLITIVPSLVAGMEWGDAVTAVVSLDLDMAEAGAAATGTEVAS